MNGIVVDCSLNRFNGFKIQISVQPAIPYSAKSQPYIISQLYCSQLFVGILAVCQLLPWEYNRTKLKPKSCTHKTVDKTIISGPRWLVSAVGYRPVSYAMLQN